MPWRRVDQPIGIRALADPGRSLVPSGRALAVEIAVIVTASAAVFLLVERVVDVEDTRAFRFLYQRHILDELLAGILVLLVGIIVTALRRLRMTVLIARAVAAQRTAFEATVASVPDALLFMDAEGTGFTNAAGGQLFGLPANQPLALTLEAVRATVLPRDALTGQPLSTADLTMTSALAGIPKERMQILRHGTTGEDRHVLMRSAPILMDGQNLGAVVIARDVTDLWSLQEGLAEANRRMRISDEGHLRMVRMIAHDLANAMAPVNLQMAVLQRGADDKAVEHAAAIMQRSTANVQRLLGDLSDMAKLETGALPLQAKPLDLADAVATAVETHRPSAQTKGLSLTFVPAAGALRIPADADRLAQVMDNLLSNAIKFTPAGKGIVVRLEATADGARIEVADGGIGLTAEQEARLFKPFSRVHNPSLLVAGSGLGLFITKGLVEGHGGRITVSSEGPGKGSTFSVWLPAAGPGAAE